MKRGRVGFLYKVHVGQIRCANLRSRCLMPICSEKVAGLIAPVRMPTSGCKPYRTPRSQNLRVSPGHRQRLGEQGDHYSTPEDSILGRRSTMCSALRLIKSVSPESIGHVGTARALRRISKIERWASQSYIPSPWGVYYRFRMEPPPPMMMVGCPTTCPTTLFLGARYFSRQRCGSSM